METLDYGSPEARALAERAAPGTLSPYDYGRALGYDGLSEEDFAWLAAQPHTAARIALLNRASSYWETSGTAHRSRPPRRRDSPPRCRTGHAASPFAPAGTLGAILES